MGSRKVVMYVVAAAAAAVMATVTAHAGLVLLVVPVMVAARLAGPTAGIVATLVAATVSAQVSQVELGVTQLVRYAALIVIGIISSLLIERLRAVRVRAQQLEHRFSESFHGSPVPLALAELRTGVFVEVNAAYERMTGWSRAELLGRTGSELGLVESNASPAVIERLERSGVIPKFAMTIVTRAGDKLDVVLAMNKMSIDGVDHVLTTVIDRTAHKRTEEALAATGKRLCDLGEAIDEVFWTAPLDGSRLGYVSPAFATMFGRSVDEVMAANGWLEWIHPEDRERVATFDASTEKAEVEFRIVRPDRSVRWVRNRRFVLVDSAGAPTSLAGVCSDITETRSLGDQLRQTQKLEALGMLAGGIAHDFNNVLAVIAASNDLLAEAIPVHAPDRELVDEVRDAVTRATAMTRQLLTFSRKQVSVPAIVDVNASISETAKLLRRTLGEDITLMLSLEPGLPHVRIDPGSLSQVVMNLAVNARDAMTGGGELEIATRIGEGEIAILVRDTGTGMPPDVCARIFEPFFTTKEKGKGTGMGLSVVHGIVEQAEGHIAVESTPGAGTTFRVTLPSVDACPEQETLTASVEPQHAGEYVLLVDDDVYVRRTIARALSTRGYQVHEASDGFTALRLLREQRVDVLLTDVAMPLMDGRELVESARRKRPTLKVLYMTGHTDDEVLRRGMQAGTIDLIEKPFRIGALTTRLRQVLDDEGAYALGSVARRE